METEKLVFRTVYVDHDVDHALRAQAAKEGVSKGAMFRRYVEAGLACVGAGEGLVPAHDDGSRLSMRTTYLTAEQDVLVSHFALNKRATRSNVIRSLMRLGMEALRG